MAGETDEAVDSTASTTSASTTSSVPEDDADFEAGFSGKATGKTETPDLEAGKPNPDKPADPKDPKDQKEPKATSTPAPDDKQPTETPPAVAKKVEIDEADLAALRSRADNASSVQAALDKAFGRIGALTQAVEKLRGDTPKGQKVEITEDDFKELTEAYPELGKLTMAAMNKALKKVGVMGSADPEAIEKVVTERVAAARAEIKQEVTDASLNAILPKWRQQVNTPAFDEWMKVQPADVQRLAESDDVSDAADMLRRFRRHLERPAPTPAPSAAPAAPKPGASARARQIAAGVAVKGDGAAQAPATTEDDGFEAGFNTRKA